MTPIDVCIAIAALALTAAFLQCAARIDFQRCYRKSFSL
jgi:hypothetical protein